MVGVLCMQHTNCGLQHLHELFDFPFCLKKLLFFFLLFLFFARHNLLRYNSSWHVEDITNAKKTNIQNQCCCFFSPPNIEISIWTYTARTERQRGSAVFFLPQPALLWYSFLLIHRERPRPSDKGQGFQQDEDTVCVYRYALPCHTCCMDGFVRGRLLIG